MTHRVGEGKDQGAVDAGGGEQLEFPGQGSDKGVGVVGTQDAGGGWIEGDGERSAAEEAGAGDDLGDNALMAEVDAVEVADGGDYRA